LVSCSLCDSNAVITLKYARMRLCASHFTRFLKRRVLRTVKRYGLINSGDKVLIAVSGGKDSSVLAHILSSLSSELKADLIGFHINLGIYEYSLKAEKSARALLDNIKIPYIILNLKDTLGMTLPEMVRKLRRPPCAVCGILKRYLMNLTAVTINATKVATGHVLEDVMQFILKEFLTSNFDRLTKMRPLIEGTPDGKLVTKIKPLYEIREKETLTYAIVNNIPFVHERCPLVDDSMMILQIKKFIVELEYNHPSLCISFVRHYNKFLKKLPLDDSLRDYIECNICSMPSSSSPCSFCRLLLSLGISPKDAIEKIKEHVKSKLKNTS